MKKLLSVLALMSVMFLGNVAQAQEYTDVAPNHWAYNYVNVLSKQGVVVGYPDGTFRPDNNITRAEFATMTIKALHQDKAAVNAETSFSDVKRDHWAYDMIQKASYFDLVKGNGDGSFGPEYCVSRAQVISIVMNALCLPELTPEQARAILAKSYTDYNDVPDWIVVQTAKAEKLGILVKSPTNPKSVDANAAASRAEVSAFLQNMMEMVKLYPNNKLAPKYGEGIVLSPTYNDGNIVTIPAGTVISLKLSECVSSQKTQTGQLFLSKTPNNYISKEKYLLLCQDDKVLGQVMDVDKALWFIRNGKLVLRTKNIKTHNNQTAAFHALGTVKPEFKTKWEKFYRAIIKHAKVEIQDGGCFNVTLLKPVKVDVTTGTIVEDCCKK
ncbi:MAG: S-layer homology domain-containing protein [Candidatus Gastranaerophilales bacterium]|nr:S-layer homology domain-containing protein [Candidatus Gastranaerophilales bacterium]